jgi:hypothetical protein
MVVFISTPFRGVARCAGWKVGNPHRRTHPRDAVPYRARITFCTRLADGVLALTK